MVHRGRDGGGATTVHGERRGGMVAVERRCEGGAMAVTTQRTGGTVDGCPDAVENAEWHGRGGVRSRWSAVVTLRTQCYGEWRASSREWRQWAGRADTSVGPFSVVAHQ